MNSKCVLGVLVFASLSNIFSALGCTSIPADEYQRIYAAFTRGGAISITAALENNQNFNHNNDENKVRSSATGFALRTTVIGLSFEDLKKVVEANLGFFTETSLGVSLVYGWTLNQFKEPVTPYYLGHYFSFNKMFQSMADTCGGADVNVKTFLKSVFTLGLKAVEDDRWAFYDHMLYLPYTIEQVRLTAPVGGAAPSLDMIIADGHL